MTQYLLPSVLLLALTACQSMYVPQAREVKKKPQSNGVIALPTSYRPEDRQKADLLMKQNCGSLAVKIADEGEVVTGQSTRSNSSATNREDTRHSSGNLFGIPLVSGSASGVETQNDAITTQLKEWQVVYDCESQKPATKAKR